MSRRIKLRHVLAVCLACAVSACEKNTLKSKEDIWDISNPSVDAGWVEFKKEARIDPRTVFKLHGDLFRIKPGNEMRIVAEEKDEIGTTHHRYAQFFNGIPVERAEFVVHSKDNIALTANGALALDFSPAVTTPAISEEQAFRVVAERIPAERYLNGENLASELADANAQNAKPAYRPRGQLIYAEKQGAPAREWVLAWTFKVYVLPLQRSRQVYINATDGSVLKETPLFANCASGSGNTTFRGNQRFNTKQQDGNYYLINDCAGNQQKAVLWDDKQKPVNVFDADNDWTGNNRSLVTSYWALDIVSDYFRLVHNRNGYDNKNANITIINDPTIGDNAFGGGGAITIGLGATNADTDDYNTVDVVGHEYGHNIIEATAKLGYDVTTEAAALNESYSDIFGMMARRWEEKGLPTDWVIGSEKGCAPPAVCRDLKVPKNYKHPDTYKGTYWQSSNIDPHNNGTVQDRWFALLTDGESGTNSETGVAYAVTGIGVKKAGKIAYRAVTRYLTSGAGYTDTRAATRQAAEDLYGANSNEAGQVINAWCAVGLCPYTQPKKPDRFDTAGGNPNPSSPDNNNTLAGATPLGERIFVVLGGRPVGVGWSAEDFPRIKVRNLSIYPLNDVDYFSIEPPNAKVPFGGRCTHKGYAFKFSNNVNAAIFSDGTQVSTYTNTSYFTLSNAETIRNLTLSVSAVFPGQIVDYDIEISFYFAFDSDCYKDGPKSKWDLIRECIMCGYIALSHGEEVILDPGYRTKFSVPIRDYHFYYDGQAEKLDIPIKILRGNTLQAQLVDETGKVLSEAQANNTTALSLNGGVLKEGVYTLRFNDFGNGTQLNVGLPRQ